MAAVSPAQPLPMMTTFSMYKCSSYWILERVCCYISVLSTELPAAPSANKECNTPPAIEIAQRRNGQIGVWQSGRQFPFPSRRSQTQLFRVEADTRQEAHYGPALSRRKIFSTK